MSPDYTVEILKGLMAHVLMVAGPLLLTGLCVGLSVSLFQAVTSLQEQTLTFVPKLAITALVLVLLGGAMMGLVVEFAQEIFTEIAQVSR